MSSKVFKIETLCDLQEVTNVSGKRTASTFRMIVDCNLLDCGM
jgi:hypothetical protein